MYNKLLVVFLFSIIIRWVSYEYFLSSVLFPADSEEYIAIAENIAAGKGFAVDGSEPVFHRAPFLPYFLSLLFSISRDYWLSIASAINIIISSGVSVVIYLISLRIVGNIAIAATASLFFAINPVSIFWSGFILTEPFFLFFFTLSILYLLKAADGQKIRDFVICGVLMGLAALTRPVMLGVIPFIALWVLIFKKGAKKGFGAAIIIFILTILPWTIRNYVNSGEIIPITSEGHNNLVQGLTEDTKTFEAVPLFTEDEENSMRHLNEWEYKKVEKKRLIRHILNHPYDILRLMIKKAIIFWSVTPEIGNPELRADIFIKLLMVLWSAYSIILYLLAIPAIFSAGNKTDIMLIIFIMISFTLMHMFFLVVPEKRFRLPLEPYLVMLSAIGLSSLRENIMNKKRFLTQRRKGTQREYKERLFFLIFFASF
ncbi:MAG: glycosyltransferase family 39 protein [Nitrospinae bacterium]|nr:glycosyltransferase family 39 protein [Nitrospinota bacterium]MBI3814137.1 glycosyltransferase family 39 protein [Nitrospinota bacterium]